MQAIHVQVFINLLTNKENEPSVMETDGLLFTLPISTKLLPYHLYNTHIIVLHYPDQVYSRLPH